MKEFKCTGRPWRQSTQCQKYFKCWRHIYQFWLWPSPLFQEKSKSVDYGKTWHLAKVPTMQVRNVGVITGQRVKIVTKKLFEEDWGGILSGQFYSTSHQSHFLLFHFTLWDFFKGYVSTDLLQVEMTKVIVRWRLSINQTFSNVNDTCNLANLLIELVMWINSASCNFIK